MRRLLGMLQVLMLMPALSAAPQARPPMDKAIKLALDRARPALLEHLRNSRGNVLALVCLAAIHDGVPKEKTKAGEVLGKALARLSKSVLRGTYGAAIRLMVLADDPSAFGVDDFERREKIVARDVASILKNRFRGGFTYARRSSFWDLSNTQYAALGLRAAVSLGHEVPEKVWKAMLETVLEIQATDGGFGYSDGHRRKRPYSSMTVAGIAVMQVCKQHLPADVVAKYEIDTAIGRAWSWMTVHNADIGISSTLSCLYFHYGLERAAVLSDITMVGDRDWYRVGADMLLRMQEKSGAWRSSWEIRPGALQGPGSPVDTAFAILFLRRKFKQRLIPRYPRLQRLGTQASESAIQAAARRAVRQGEAALPQVLRAMRSKIPARRRAAALALAELAGQDFGYDPKDTPEKSGVAIKAAEFWWLKRVRKK